MMHAISQQSHRVSENLLESGDFDRLTSIRHEGWESRPSRNAGISSTADVIRDSTSGQVLRLVAWKSDAIQKPFIDADTPALVVTSPAIPVEPGDVILVSGRIRRGRAVPTLSARPLLVFDSELGIETALKMELDSEWQSFEMIRPIALGSEFRLSLALTDQAEVHVDNLQIRKLPAMPPVSEPPVLEAGLKQ